MDYGERETWPQMNADRRGFFRRLNRGLRREASVHKGFQGQRAEAKRADKPLF
jgi:hypothetical protein